MPEAAGHGRMTPWIGLGVSGLVLVALLGIAAGQGAPRMNEIEQDLMAMVQGNFTPDALGPDHYRAVLGRVRARPKPYLDVLEARFVTVPIDPVAHSNLHLGVALRVTAEGERARSQAIARRLLRQYDAVLIVYDEAKDKAALLELLPEETGRMLQRLHARRAELREIGGRP